MSQLFSAPSPPKVKPVDNKAIAEATAEALRRRQQAKGYRATILSQMAGSASGPQQTIGS